jgi:hypothetical protein
MTSTYDGRLLTTLVDDRLRAADTARAGRTALLLRRALRAAETAHRRALRADRRAAEAHGRVSGTVRVRTVVAR